MGTDNSNPNLNFNVTPSPILKAQIERTETAADALLARMFSLHAPIEAAMRAIHEAPADTLPQEVIALWASHAAAQTDAIADLTRDGTALIDALRELLTALRT